jgi:CheY-like chemotaxis protein
MTSSRPAALIVEDQPFVGLVASDILRESGFETFHAFDAAAADKMLGEHPEIADMVADADLPGSLSGLELVRRIARERPNLQLVVTSAGKAIAPNEMPEGARMLRKPYASGELRQLVSNLALLQEV